MHKIMGAITIAAMFIVVVAISCRQKTEGPDVAIAKAVSNDSLIKRGQYLVSVSGCEDCHSPKKMGAHGPELVEGTRFAGFLATQALPKVDASQVKNGWVLFVGDNTATVGPWGASFASNISSDATGIGNWKEEQFIKALKQGKWMGLDSGRTLLPPMPWQNFSHLPDEDVKAIFAFLKSTKPVSNIVPPPKELVKL